MAPTYLSASTADTSESRAQQRLTARSLLLPAAICVVVTAGAWRGRVTAIDRRGTDLIVRPPHSIGFRVGQVLSVPGAGPCVAVVAFVVAAVVWHRLRDPIAAAITPVAAAVAGAAELAAKHVVGRLRPVTAALAGEAGFGFPSGHTTGFTALAVAVLFVAGALNARWCHPVVNTVMLIGAWLVAAGRVLVGAHYLFDVVAGVALGLLCTRSVVLAASWYALRIRHGDIDATGACTVGRTSS